MQAISSNIFLTVYGEPASKANSRRAVRVGGRSLFIKSPKALAYCKAFQQQTADLGHELFVDDVCVTIHIWYASRRPDLDESLILDLLQGVAYVNDRQVKERHCYWHLDKENPRCTIEVSAIA
jgi:Holliday junction resolvase RusA-like endonuclease